MSIRDYVAGMERIVRYEAHRLGVDAPRLAPGRGMVKNQGEVEIVLPGWTPTLHRHEDEDLQDVEAIALDLYPWKDDAEEAWGLTGIAAMDVTVSARMLLHYLEPLFAEQVERRKAARRLGIHSPIDDLSNVAHVRLDRWTRDALVSIGRDPAATVREMLKALYGDGDFVASIEMETAKVDIDAVLLEHGGRPLPLALIGLPVRRGVTFDGHAVAIDGIELPDTLMNAVVGRRLGDVLDDVPHLADRIVTAAEGWVQFNGPQSQGKAACDPPGGHDPVLKLWVEPDSVGLEG